MLTLLAERFDELEAYASERLIQRGYALVRRERSGLFGSHCSEFMRGSRSIRLAWDGRDRQLTLSYVEDLTVAGAPVHVLLSMFLGRKSSRAIDLFARQLHEQVGNAI